LEKKGTLAAFVGNNSGGGGKKKEFKKKKDPAYCNRKKKGKGIFVIGKETQLGPTKTGRSDKKRKRRDERSRKKAWGGAST